MVKMGDRIRNAGAQLANANTDILPGWVLNLGITSWVFIGATGALIIVALFVSASSSISIPLILAAVIGMVAYPLVERMTDRGVPVQAAATIVLLGLGGIVVLTFWITFAGILSQWSSISAQLVVGLGSATEALRTAGFDATIVQKLAAQVRAAGGSGSGSLVGGLFATAASTISSGLTSTFALIFGVFIGAFLLYYVLSDFPNMARWAGRHMGGLSEEVGTGIVDDAVSAMRSYFRATTVSGLVAAVVIGAAMLLLGVPLVVPVILVTFLTCYIPFFGAILSGIFAFTVALGSNGLTSAMVVLIVVLVAQNVIQTIVATRVMGDSMNLHPLVVLVATMLGGTFGGLLGAALGAPVAALLVSAGKRLASTSVEDAAPDTAAKREAGPAAESS